MKFEIRGKNSTDCEVLIDGKNIKDTIIKEININVSTETVVPTVTITYVPEEIVVDLKGDWDKEIVAKSEKEEK